jgi:RNA polymerase sigma-70 factor (ECF subfamily)
MEHVNAWIERWRQGDERAAELLYNHFCNRTYRLAYGLLGHREDAEEVAQDALTYALVNISHFDAEKSQFGTWLHTITVSRCRDKRRRKVLPGFSLTAWLQRGQDLPAHEPTPEQATAVTETNRAVWQAVQSLKPAYREAVVLRYWVGLTYKEMAEVLDCPVPTAQSRVRLAFDKLKAELAAPDLAALQEANDW